MLTKCINEVPQQGRMNVIQAAIFNMNMRLVALARQQLAMQNRDNSLFAVPEGGYDEDSVFERGNAGGSGTFQFGQHIDGAGTLAERDRSAEESQQVTHEQGHETPPDPRKQAEQFVTFRDMLLLKYYDECNKVRRRPLDQSFASVINWMHDREFVPNNAEAQAVFMASKGRVSLEQAINAQKRRHADERARLAKIAEPLLKTMEDFGGVDLSEVLQTETPTHIDGDTVIDTLFENMTPIIRLGVVNVMWRRCHRLVTDDFPSRRVPTQDFAADIALAINAEDEFLAYAKTLYEAAHDEYHARMAAGLPVYDVVVEIERLKKSAAQKASKPLAAPAKAA